MLLYDRGLPQTGIGKERKWEKKGKENQVEKQKNSVDTGKKKWTVKRKQEELDA